MVAERMRVAYLLIGLVMCCAGGAQAQFFFTQKKVEPKFDSPTSRLEEKLRKSLTEQELARYMWQFRTDTDPFDLKIRQNIVQSETTPFRSRRSVWADETMPARAAEFGAGKYSDEAIELPTIGDRWAASQLPEANYTTKVQDDAILATVYRHFFEYRTLGFAKNATVYFLGQGPHKDDIPPSLLAALQSDPQLKRDGVKLRPASRSLEITAAEIRDRDTGAYGPVFRVDDVSLEKDGEVRVMASFSERDGFWFTRELTLQQGKGGWAVVKDNDYPIN
jgi:hypothetical protein